MLHTSGHSCQQSGNEGIQAAHLNVSLLPRSKCSGLLCSCTLSLLPSAPISTTCTSASVPAPRTSDVLMCSVYQTLDPRALQQHREIACNRGATPTTNGALRTIQAACMTVVQHTSRIACASCLASQPFHTDTSHKLGCQALSYSFLSCTHLADSSLRSVLPSPSLSSSQASQGNRYVTPALALAPAAAAAAKPAPPPGLPKALVL
jgi:hypothetical protein